MELMALETQSAHDAGAEMRVYDQFGKPTDVYITMAGPDSKIWVSESRKRQVNAISGIDDKVEPEDMLAMVTLSWRGLVDKGQPVECNQEASASLYRKAPYIFRQADKFVGKRANFSKPSVKK